MIQISNKHQRKHILLLAHWLSIMLLSVFTPVYAGPVFAAQTITNQTNYIDKYFEIDQNGHWKMNIYLGDQILATVDDTGTTTYPLTDHLGSPTIITNQNGNIVEANEYDPLGNIIYTTSTIKNTKKFTGKELDKETNLQYYGARYLDNQVGRFMSVDPLQFYLVSKSALYKKTNKGLSEVLSNPQALNSYAYAINNPVNKVDQNGECVWDACAVEGYSGYMVTTGVAATAVLVYNQYGEQINKAVVDTVTEASKLGRQTLDSIKEGAKNIWNDIKNIFKKDITSGENASPASQQIEGAPETFPENPNDFNPKGWDQKTYKDPNTGRDIKKWRSPDGKTEYEWHEGEPGKPSHWHKGNPPFGPQNHLPNPNTSDPHSYPRDPFY